jgi:hypothetical protein
MQFWPETRNASVFPAAASPPSKLTVAELNQVSPIVEIFISNIVEKLVYFVDTCSVTVVNVVLRKLVSRKWTDRSD